MQQPYKTPQIELLNYATFKDFFFPEICQTAFLVFFFQKHRERGNGNVVFDGNHKDAGGLLLEVEKQI